MSGFDDTVKAAVAALAAAVATTAVVSASQWLKARGEAKHGQSQLDLAARQLAVLSSWVGLQAQLNPDADPSSLRALIQPDLDAAIAAVHRTQREVGREKPRVSARRLAEVIFLTDLQAGALAKTLRLLYWCYLAIALFLVPVFISASATLPDSDLSTKIFVGIFGLLFLVLLALFLRWLIRRAERRRDGDSAIGASTSTAESSLPARDPAASPTAGARVTPSG